MGSFDAFKKKADAPQKTLICARCKKEITDEESKWIGNHRFCKDCAAPLKVATNKVPVKSKENAYKSKKDKPQWLKSEDVYQNFVALFLVKFKPYNTEKVGIWKDTNQPVIIREEVDGHYVSRYQFVKNLSFREVRAYAKFSKNTVSIMAHYFLDVDEYNWETLFEKAVSENENQLLKTEYPCSILTNKDERFNINRMRILEQQLSQIDSIIDNTINKRQNAYSSDFLEKTKEEAETFMKGYILDPMHSFTFYWSEYPMGAIHSKEFRRINSVWCVYQYDYDKQPPERRTEYPDINDDNILEGLVEILLTEG